MHIKHQLGCKNFLHKSLKGNNSIVKDTNESLISKEHEKCNSQKFVPQAMEVVQAKGGPETSRKAFTKGLTQLPDYKQKLKLTGQWRKKKRALQAEGRAHGKAGSMEESGMFREQLQVQLKFRGKDRRERCDLL